MTIVLLSKQKFGKNSFANSVGYDQQWGQFACLAALEC